MADLKREIEFPNDYDKSKIDPRSKQRSDAIRNWRIARLGGDIRAAMADGVDIASVNSVEAKNTAANAQNIAQETQKRFDTQINGQDKDNESKDARYSEADNKTYNTLRDRLGAMDKKPQQAVDNLQIQDVNLLLDTDKWVVGQGASLKFAIQPAISELAGKKVTISFRVDFDKVTALNDRQRVVMGFSCSNGTKSTYFDKELSPNVGDSYHGVITSSFTIPSDTTTISATLYNQGVVASNLKVGHAKLQYGDKATGWTPNPADSHHHQAFRHGTRFFAHRGAQSIAPENSFPAIDKAGNHAGVEIDIHVTSDNVWVVMHDGTVDRMTNGTGAISSFTFDNIRKLRLDTGSRLKMYSDDEKIIPTLTEALAHCKNRQLIPVIEIKVDNTDKYTADNYDDLAGIINKFGLADECMFISFNYEALQEIKKRLPLVEVSWLVGAINSDNIAKAQQLGVNSGLDVNYTDASVNSNNITACHNVGLKVGVWTLPNDDKRSFLTGSGVDFITTNSLSGELRYAELECKNGWSNYNADDVSCVQEVAPGIINLRFKIIGDANGTTKKGDIFATFPSWAKPAYYIWNPCIIKTEAGEVYQSSFDITRNNLMVGVHWEHKAKGNGWIVGNVTYHV